MPSYPSLGRAETSSTYYPSSAAIYDRDSVLSQRSTRDENSLPRHESSASAQPHSSFLIDDILGKKEREREECRLKDRNGERVERDRRSEIDEDINRSTDNESELDRSRVEYEHSERRCERDNELDRLHERERELQCNRYRLSARDRESRDSIIGERHSHLHSIAASKQQAQPLPSSPVSTTTLLSVSDIPRPTPINPAAIQTGALTTPTIYKPLPTIYDQSALTQAAYLNPHLSPCQTSLMRQMCGNFGTLGSLPGYGRHEYPAIFENQYNAFSKCKYVQMNKTRIE